MRRYANIPIATFVALIIATSVSAGPDAQKSLRSVANIARMAIDATNCVEPDDGTTDPWIFGPPPPTYFDGGTPNQKMLVKVWHYGWALRTRPSDLGTIRATLLDFINRQTQVTGSGGPFGHYSVSDGGSEELTSSHYQLWSGALAAAYLFAIADGGTLTSVSDSTTRETAVRDAARKWWSDERALYDLVFTNAELDSPGGRFAHGFPTTGDLITNPLRDDIYRLLKGGSPVKVRTCSADRYYTGSFVMQALKAKGVPALGQPPAGHTPGPKLFDTLCVYRMGSDWTLYFPDMRGVGGALYWVQFRNGQIKRATVPYDGVKPSAYLPNSASRTTIPGVVPGAVACPQPEAINQ